MNPFEGNIAFDGYKDLELLYKNEKHEVLKGIQVSDDTLVVLKSSRSVTGHLREASKLGHEYEILKELDHPGIPKVYDLLHKSDQITIVQQFFSGPTLNELLFKGKIPQEKILKIAVQLADILRYLHEKGIIHKDINSSNVILGEDESVKLIDFGISTNLHFEQSESLLIDHIEGTLTNIAPEQTGRTAYSVTHSCDLYSFGILLYELLTGKPPFDSADPLEIIHFHLSRKPVPLKKVVHDLPFGLDEVVNKLLEKNPDDRYQSARGLKYDLEQLASFLKKKEEPEEFKICTRDSIDHYRQTQKLYGREKELEMLLGHYKHLNELKSMMVLVAGYSGVGKSALIDNVKYPIIQDKGLFITGKYDQFKRNIPYYAFIEAFQEMIKTLLAESDETIEQWSRRIQFSLGKNGALITEVIPLLTKIIGKQSKVQKLQPAEQETRFNMVLLDFVYAFTSTHSPLVIFLDDLQWADLPSLNLIKMILQNPRKEGVMLLGAYRDNEVGENHPLQLTLNELEKVSAHVKSIELKPLTEKTTALIAADSFGMNSKTAQELGKSVYKKTKGNPFFINRFLKSLYENGLVEKNSLGDWVFNTEKIDSLEYTDNVVDLMIDELINLPEETRNAIKLAAVLGNSFELQDLSTISGLPINKAYKQLRPALTGGFLKPVDKKYRAMSLSKVVEGPDVNTSSLNVGLKFTHDKVQQAAYALISDFERERIHLETGRLLLKNSNEEELQEDIFELLNHFSIGYSLIDEQDEKDAITELCLTAGRKAKDSTSYDLAVKYLNMAKNLLGRGSWISKYDLNFAVLSELGECEYLNNNSVKAEEYFHEVLSYAKTRFEKIKVQYVHSSLYLKEGNTTESLRIGLEAVKLYNVRFPSSPKVIQVAAMVEMVKYIFLFSTRYRNTEKLFNIPDCTDEEIIVLNKFLIDLATSAYQQDQNLMMLVIFRIIKSYLKNGFTDASGWGFSGFSVVMLSVIKMQNRGFFLWDVTERMHRRTSSTLIKWRLGYTVACFYYPWKKPIREFFEESDEIVKASVLNGDQIFTGYTISMIQRHKFFGSVPLNQLLDSKKNFIELTRQSTGGHDFFRPRYQLIKTLAGKTGSDHWDDNEYSGVETKEAFLLEGNKTKLEFYLASQLTMLYYYGHYREALDISKELVPYLDNATGDTDVFEYNFYSALAIAANYSSFTKPEQNKYLSKFKKHLKNIKYWRKGCRTNFDQHYQLLVAELAAMKGEVERALQLYEKAMTIAAKNGFIYVEALANERAAAYAFEHEFTKQARVYLRDAWDRYHAWGAEGKCKQLEQNHPSLLRHEAHLPQQHAGHVTITSTSSAVSLDLSTILKASQSIASTVKYDDLLKNLMNIAIENAGAERGSIISEQRGELCVEAEAKTGVDGAEILDSVPLKKYDQLPESLLLYSWRSGESVVVSDAQAEERFSSDPYVIHSGVLSMMCLPITEKGRVIGLLYLENNLMRGVFTDDRLELLHMLSGQIGISIENALLYENLEEKVRERTEEIEKQKVLIEEEKEKSDKLLLNILPHQIADELKSEGHSKARSYSNVTVMFCDIVGFTQLGEKLDADTLVQDIHEFFSGIDDIVNKHEIEKIKTIGDAYLCANGLDESEDGSSAVHMVEAAQEIMAYLTKMNKSKEKGDRPPFELRIGIHTGPVVAGVVGKAKFAYDIWGDTVNTAARMETHGEPMRINVSEETYQLVKDKFSFEHRGKVEAKNKGLIDMYFIK
ncbi:MAG: AAA family ATPase [Bacteroidia bacterium]